MPAPTSQIIRSGITPLVSDPAPFGLYALKFPTVSDYFYALVNEVGSASGFGFAVGIYFTAAAVGAAIQGRDNASTITQGYAVTSANYYGANWHVANGSAVDTLSGTGYTNSVAGRWHVFAFHNSSANLSVYVNGLQWATSSITGYNAGTLGWALGRRTGFASGAGPEVYVTPHIAWTGNAAPTTMLNLANYFRDNYDWPATLSGLTITHRHSLRSHLNSSVTSGQAAPAGLRDYVTSSYADGLRRQATPTVVVADPSVEGRAHYGIMPWNVEHYYTSSVPMDTPTHFCLHVKLLYLGSPAGNRYIFGAMGATGGFELYVTSVNITFRIRSAGVLTTSTIGTNAGSNTGTPGQYCFYYDGTAIRAYRKFLGGPVETLTTTTGAIASTSVTAVLGRDTALAANTSGAGFMTLGLTLATSTGSDMSGEIAPAMVESEVNATMAGFSGRDLNRYIPKVDIIANGGPEAGSVATLVDKFEGSAVQNDFIRQGTETNTVSKFVERFFHFETTPVCRGADGFTSVSYFQTVSPVDISSGPFWVNVVFLPTTIAGTKTLVSTKPSGTTGAGFRLQLVDTGMLFTVYNDAGTALSHPTSGTVNTANVVYMCTFYWNGSTSTVYMQGAQGNSTAMAVTGANTPSSPLRVGVQLDGFNPASSCRIFSVSCGTGPMTEARARSMYDTLVSSDGNTAPQLLGQTTGAWALVDDTGVIPATVLDASPSGNDLTRNGSPTVYPLFARRFAVV